MSAIRFRPLVQRRVGATWEMPTMALAAVIYGGWLALTWYWQALPWPIACVIGSWLLAWHGSLQHEAMHGHPTPYPGLNTAIAEPPLALWLPFELYRQSHLRHHREPWLTDPIEDPESAYLTHAVWQRTGWLGRVLYRFNLTLLGRLTLGPFLTLATVYGREVRNFVARHKRTRAVWARHALGCLVVLVWLEAVCGVPLWLYFLGAVIPSIALTRLRAFAEHRFADEPEHRTAIVEDSRLFGLLFLFNNLHVVHHRWPTLPWYRIPQRYRRDRTTFVERNGGLVYRGYREVARRFLLNPHDELVHPRHGASRP